MAVSQPKMVRFSFCKKDFKARNANAHANIAWGGSIGENTVFYGSQECLVSDNKNAFLCSLP